jgi:hypothetical protein
LSILGITSSTSTSSATVELFVLSFCLVEAKYTDPFPRDIVPPVWLFISVVCTAAKKGCVHPPLHDLSVVTFEGQC